MAESTDDLMPDEAAPSEASDEGTAPEEPGAEDEAAEGSEEPTEDSGEKTALLPKSILGDCKEGDELTMKVVRVHGDEVEVEYLNHEPGGEAAEGQGSMMDRTVAKMGASGMAGAMGGGAAAGGGGY